MPYKAKLFAGIMYLQEEIYRKAVERLVEKFGEIESESSVFKFNFTDYYEEEMGRGLMKKFVIFKNPIHRENLADIKIFTIALEKEFSINGKRSVNIDPGYLTEANLILATTKQRAQRIYLRDSIFAEVTMMFGKNKCIFFEYTYPDFRLPEVCGFFLKARGLYTRHANE